MSKAKVLWCGDVDTGAPQLVTFRIVLVGVGDATMCMESRCFDAMGQPRWIEIGDRHPAWDRVRSAAIQKLAEQVAALQVYVPEWPTKLPAGVPAPKETTQ